MRAVLRAVEVAPRVFAWLVRLRRFLGHFTALYGHCTVAWGLRRLYTRARAGVRVCGSAHSGGGVLPRTIPNESLGQTAVIRRGRGGSAGRQAYTRNKLDYILSNILGCMLGAFLVAVGGGRKVC